jgi:6-pyruvoyl-tetrahydropterin synthase
MKIETAIRFTATHEHVIPPGVMSDRHEHQWTWTVRLVGPLDPIYGWVADSRTIAALMRSELSEHFDLTAEQILLVLAGRLARRLPPGVRMESTRLQENDELTAIYEPEVPHA